MNFLFGFSGRIGRGRWWLGQLVSIVILIVALVLLTGLYARSSAAFGGLAALLLFGGYAMMVWVNVAVTVKRYHDRDKPWPWVLIMLVPFIGGVWQFVECGFLPGSPGRNTYGDPHGQGSGPALRTRDRFDNHVDNRRNDAIIERWTTIVSVTEKTAPQSRDVAATTVRADPNPTGTVTFGRRGR